MNFLAYLSTAATIVAISIPLSASSEIGQADLISYDRQTPADLVLQEGAPVEFARRGRGRGGKGGRRPRVPGGSGCDDPGDIIEHPECRG